jgi:hypothetical protein
MAKKRRPPAALTMRSGSTVRENSLTILGSACNTREDEDENDDDEVEEEDVLVAKGIDMGENA